MLTRYPTVAARLAVAGAILSIAMACGERRPASSASASALYREACHGGHVGTSLKRTNFGEYTFHALR